MFYHSFYEVLSNLIILFPFTYRSGFRKFEPLNSINYNINYYKIIFIHLIKLSFILFILGNLCQHDMKIENKIK
jgi:uncharacterized membrane protein